MSDTETIILKKPKKPRSQKQLDATARLVASNKARREAKALVKSGASAPEPVPEPVPPPAPAKKKCCKNCDKGKPCEKKEETPIEAVVEKKPRKKYTRKAPPLEEHYLESESEEEDLEAVQELAPEPRSFRIPRHMRK